MDKMDIPHARSHGSNKELQKRGYLLKLSSRGFPYIPQPWKRKYCVLLPRGLYYYDSDSARGSDKGSGAICLDYYDQVLEASAKECKRASHVFVLTSQDRNFFDQGRQLFSCESAQDMKEWVQILKRNIEQTRNNHRPVPTTPTTTAHGSPSSQPSVQNIGHTSPSKTESGGPRPVSASAKAEYVNKEKQKKGEEEKTKINREEEQAVENKENLEDWTNRKQKYSESSLRRRKGNTQTTSPYPRLADEPRHESNSSTVKSLDPTNANGSLTRQANISNGKGKQNQTGVPKSAAKSGASGVKKSVAEMEDHPEEGKSLRGSMDRQSKSADKSSSSPANKGGDKSNEDKCGSEAVTVERRKRKADDAADDAASEEQLQQNADCEPHLESVTKHRVKGPAGRRVPQNRRTQQLMMKHRASSLSALAHNPDIQQQQSSNNNNNNNSFVPWLNRSLDLLGEDLELHPSTRHSQPTLGYLYQSNQDDQQIYEHNEQLYDEQQQLYEYNISLSEQQQNCTYDENSTGSGLFVLQDDSTFVPDGGGGYQQQGNVNLGAGGAAIMPPPLPPRMESRMDYGPSQNGGIQTSIQQQQHDQFQMQHHMQQMQQYQANLQQQRQVFSPFGTEVSSLDRERKKQHRRSQPIDDIMTKSLTNELFIASYSDDNSCDASNPQLQQPQQKQQQKQQKQSRVAAVKNKDGARSNNGGQKGRKGLSQPDVNRFNAAVSRLQQHVVELDGAVSAIATEAEDSGSLLSSVKTTVASLRRDTDRVSDAIAVVTQEVARVKEQVAAAHKEAEKLQKAATAALVVAEKAKVDQLHLKKEYEAMLCDLKTAIQNIKKDAMQNLAATIVSRKKAEVNVNDVEEHLQDDDEEEAYSEMEEDRKNQHLKKKEKASGYQSFFSRPSSIISGLTNRASMVRSATSIDSLEREKCNLTDSPKKSKEKDNKDRVSRADSKSNDKKIKKEKQGSNKSRKETLSPDRSKSKKVSKNLSEDFPMMDESVSSSPLSRVGSDSGVADADSSNLNNNYSISKSMSSPTVPSRPRALNLIPQRSEVTSKATSATSSPDSPTRPSSPPFDGTRLHPNGRAVSPTGFALHRPGSTPGPLNRQGSMTTVPEDRAIDTRAPESNRPSEPPPPPPPNRGVFAISRQNSSPNIAIQRTSPPVLQKQHSLGVVSEDDKNRPISRQSSLGSVIDDRCIVDQTLPLSPTPSMMSFPGSWSTTSLNRPDSTTGFTDAPLKRQSSSGTNTDLTPIEVLEQRLSQQNRRSAGALEQVAGAILAGSGLQQGVISPFDDSATADPPLATSSLKKRKKVKKEP